MFKTKFTLITKDWEILHTYKSRVKPNEGEYIYIKNTYYKVKKVIHSFKLTKQILLIVEKTTN